MFNFAFSYVKPELQTSDWQGYAVLAGLIIVGLGLIWLVIQLKTLALIAKVVIIAIALSCFGFSVPLRDFVQTKINRAKIDEYRKNVDAAKTQCRKVSGANSSQCNF
jgi:hypothetical protein